MFRLLVRRQPLLARRLQPTLASRQVQIHRLFGHSAVRHQLSQEDLEKVRNSDTVRKITSDPELSAKFNDICQYIIQNNLIDPSKPPGPMQVMKMMMSKEVRDKVTDFAEAADKAGVSFDASEFTELMQKMKR